MGLLRDVTLGVARAALGAVQKAIDDQDGPPDGPKGDRAAQDQPEGKDGPPGFAPPPPPPPAVPNAPAITVGDGPTLAAPAQEITEAAPKLRDLEKPAGDPKSLLWDPFAIVDALGYKDNPRPITYATLNSMVWQTPPIHAIIKTRVDQVVAFARPQVDKYTPGMRVSMRNKKQKPTPASERRSQEIERWLLTTGTTGNPAAREDFATFLKKFTRDSLIYDQACVEVIPSLSGKPAAFQAVDASTIRIADTTRLHLDPEDQAVVRLVQVYDGMVVAEFNSSEMGMLIRNPTANITNQGYGQSELEMLTIVITALLYAFDFNKRAFSQGTAAKGIINLKGIIPENQLNGFRAQWYQMMSGVQNAHRTPITNADGLEFINMMNTNRDMEYNAWMDWLQKIACAVYGMDPIEINFKYGDSGGAKSMFESAGTSKLTASKDKGLKPLLASIEAQINKSLIYPLDEDFVFEFVGFEASTPAEQADLVTKQVKVYKTVNEARAEDDMPPLPNGLGDIILDPVYMQHLAMSQQAAQQNQQAEQAPSDGQPGGDFGGDDQDGAPEGPDGLQSDDPANPDGLDAEPADAQQEAPEGVAEKSLRKSEFALAKYVTRQAQHARRLRKAQKPTNSVVIDVEC